MPRVVRRRKMDRKIPRVKLGAVAMEQMVRVIHSPTAALMHSLCDDGARLNCGVAHAHTVHATPTCYRRCVSPRGVGDRRPVWRSGARRCSRRARSLARVSRGISLGHRHPRNGIAHVAFDHENSLRSRDFIISWLDPTPRAWRLPVAVGTCVSSHAPRTEPYVRLSRIRLPPRVCDGKASARPRMEDDRFREPGVR